jgi:hypothetical protein
MRIATACQEIILVVWKQFFAIIGTDMDIDPLRERRGDGLLYRNHEMGRHPFSIGPIDHSSDTLTRIVLCSALVENKTPYSNRPFPVPEGHIPMHGAEVLKDVHPLNDLCFAKLTSPSFSVSPISVQKPKANPYGTSHS